jgi:transposase InsO family protein
MKVGDIELFFHLCGVICIFLGFGTLLLATLALARASRVEQVRAIMTPLGSVGDCFGNAVMESFWSRVHVELLDRKRWRTRVELANAIFEYLEIFHNRQGRHSSLGMLTPVEFEARRRPTTAA